MSIFRFVRLHYEPLVHAALEDYDEYDRPLGFRTVFLSYVVYPQE